MIIAIDVRVGGCVQCLIDAAGNTRVVDRAIELAIAILLVAHDVPGGEVEREIER